MAVKHAVIKDTPIKELLGGIKDGLVKRLLETKYGGDVSKVPVVDYLAPAPVPVSAATPEEIKVSKTGDAKVYEFGTTLPDASAWFETLVGPELSWLRAFVMSPTFVQGTSYIDNPIRRLLIPRPNQKVHVTSSSVVIYGAARSWGEHKPDFKAVEILYDTSSKLISLTIFEDRTNSSVGLPLLFQYTPSNGAAPIHEIAEGRNNRIKEFYWKLWYGDNSSMPALKVNEVFEGPEVTIDAAAVEQFCAVVGNQSEAFKTARTDKITAPMDFAIVTGWQASIFCPCIFLPR